MINYELRITNYKLILGLLLISLLFSKASWAQTSNPDQGLWNTVSFIKGINEKWTFQMDEELRLKDKFRRLNLLYTNVGMSYKLFKGVKFGLTYRFIDKYTDEDVFSYRHRLMFDASYKYKIGDFSLSYRSRFQAEVKNYNSSKKGHIPEWFWRNKFEAKYTIGDFAPYAGIEVRYQIYDPRNEADDKGFHRARSYFGVDYEINENHALGIYYLFQRERTVDEPNDLNILGLEYTFTLPYKAPKPIKAN